MKLKKSMSTLMVAAALTGGVWSGQASACAGSDPMIASVCIFAGNFAPRGYAFTNGQLLSISGNTTLFALIGTIYGGNGVSSFGLPDTRGRVVIGVGQGPGLSNYFEGQSGGNETVVLSVNNMPAHTHGAVTNLSTFTATLRGNSATGNADGPSGNSLAARPRSAEYSTSAPNVDMASGSVTISGSATTTIAPAGGNQAFSIIQPYVAMNYLIALVGVFPSLP